MASTPAQREAAMNLVIAALEHGGTTFTDATPIKTLIEDGQKVANFIADDTVPS